MERKEPYASQEEFNKRVVHYPDVPPVEVFPGATSHLVSVQNITLSFITLNPNITTAPHRHESEQLMIVVDGEVDQVVEGKTYHLKKGDVIHMPSNAEHGAFVSDKGCQAIDVFSPPREDLVAKLKEVQRRKS